MIRMYARRLGSRVGARRTNAIADARWRNWSPAQCTHVIILLYTIILLHYYIGTSVVQLATRYSNNNTRHSKTAATRQSPNTSKHIGNATSPVVNVVYYTILCFDIRNTK